MDDLPARRLTAPVSFQPQTLAELMEFAKLVAQSGFVPEAYRGKPADILVAIQWGAELGLAPLQALQGISVINGRPSVWGDTALALVRGSGLLVDFDEGVRGEGQERIGYCAVCRKGESPTEKTFSVQDAIRAKLWGKLGPWTQYPDRMLMLRARGFVLRDVFADVLRGVITREEAQDVPTEQPPRAESGLPWAKRLSETTARVEASPAAPAPPGAAAVEGAVPESSIMPELTSPPSASEESEVGTAPPFSLEPSPSDEPLPDEPVLINADDRRRLFAIARAHGHQEADLRRYLFNVYGVLSTSEIQADWLDAICERLKKADKLFA